MKGNVLGFGIPLFGLIAGVTLMGFVHAQAPPPSIFPSQDFTYTCTPTNGTAPPVEFKFTAAPAPHVDVFFGANVASNDKTPPVINSVLNSVNVNVLPGGIRITTTNGVPLTITASDNVGVVWFRLDVDGLEGPKDGNAALILPLTFYARWNARNVAPGLHHFKLTVSDLAGNQAVKEWDMVR